MGGRWRLARSLEWENEGGEGGDYAARFCAFRLLCAGVRLLFSSLLSRVCWSLSKSSGRASPLAFDTGSGLGSDGGIGIEAEWRSEVFEGGGVVVVLFVVISISTAEVDWIDSGRLRRRIRGGIPLVVVSVNELASAEVPGNGRAEMRQKSRNSPSLRRVR